MSPGRYIFPLLLPLLVLGAGSAQARSGGGRTTIGGLFVSTSSISSSTGRAAPTRPGLWARLSYPASHAYRQLLSRAEALISQHPLKAARHKEAKSLLERAIGMSPRRAEAHRLLGELQAAVGKQLLAVAAFGQALKVDPRYLPRYVNYRLALALAMAGQYVKAAKAFAALPRKGDSKRLTATLMGNAAECFMAAGHLLQALKLFRQARSRDTGYLPAAYGLAVALHRDGQPKRAHGLVKALLRSDPKLAHLLGPHALFFPAASRHYHLALVHEARGKTALAKLAWQRFLKAAPKGPWALQARQALRRLTAPPPRRALARRRRIR